MDIKALKTFLEVTKTHHFGHAANNLFVSQSTVSARIRALEESLGTELFIRERGNIRLSSNGEALVSHAKTILTLWGRARQEVGMPDAIENSLIIGGLSGLWDISLQQWLSKVTTMEPSLLVSADIFSADTLIERVMNRSMDIAFLYDAPQGVNLISIPLEKIHLKLVASIPTKTVEEALAIGFISVNWGLNFAMQFAAAFPDLGASRLNTSLGRIAYEYLRDNQGCAYLADSVITHSIQSGELFYVPGAPVFERQAYAIFHQENDKQQLILSLLDKL